MKNERLDNSVLESAINVYKSTVIFANKNNNTEYNEALDKVTIQLLEELKQYRELEEQGLLLRLPCKIGDKAWYVHKGGIDEVEVDSFVVNVNIFVNVTLYIGCERFGKTLTPYKTLFFTQSEAEEKLRELEGK